MVINNKEPRGLKMAKGGIETENGFYRRITASPDRLHGADKSRDHYAVHGEKSRDIYTSDVRLHGGGGKHVQSCVRARSKKLLPRVLITVL